MLAVIARQSERFARPRDSEPFWRISFTLRGGFGPSQADGISISPSAVSIPQEIDLSFEYVTSFICLPLYPISIVMKINKLKTQQFCGGLMSA